MRGSCCLWLSCVHATKRPERCWDVVSFISQKNGHHKIATLPHRSHRPTYLLSTPCILQIFRNTSNGKFSCALAAAAFSAINPTPP